MELGRGWGGCQLKFEGLVMMIVIHFYRTVEMRKVGGWGIKEGEEMRPDTPVCGCGPAD